MSSKTPPLQQSITVICDIACRERAVADRFKEQTHKAMLQRLEENNSTLLHSERTGEGKETLVWSDAQITIGDDLHPAVVAALDGELKSQAGRRLPCFSLGDKGLAVLNGQLSRPGGDPRELEGFTSEKGLAVQLGPQAIGRLKAAGEDVEAGRIVLTVDQVRVLLPSEIGLIAMRLRFAKREPSSAMLKEVLPLLSHREPCARLHPACITDPAETEAVGIADLLTAVLPNTGCGFEAWNRFYTYTFAQVPGFSATQSVAGGTPGDLAFRLARHYTDAYDLTEDLINPSIVQFFADQVHAVSLEGGATVVDASNAFLRDQFPAIFENTYLPLVWLAYHEHAYLTKMAQRFATGERLDPGEAAPLRDLIRDFVTFRLRFRKALVSDISMHNELYGALRAGLRVDALTEKVVRDCAEAERQLSLIAEEKAAEANHEQEARNKRFEKRAAPWQGLFYGALTFLTMNAAFKEVLKLLQKLGDKDASGGFWAFMASWGSLGAAGIAFGLALLAGILAYKRHKNEAEEHGTAAHSREHLEEKSRIKGVQTAVKGQAAGAASADQLTRGGNIGPPPGAG